MSEDSSLNEPSVEIVSHPMTYEYHLCEAPWKRIMAIAKKHRFESNCKKYGNCGLHISVNRSFFGDKSYMQALGALKMIRIMQRFEDEWRKVSRRTHFGYCSFETRHNYDANWVDAKEKCAWLLDDEFSHSLVINMQHHTHFEVRLFAGTLSYPDFMCSLLFVRALAKLCKIVDYHWVETCTFDDLIEQMCLRLSRFEGLMLKRYLLRTGVDLHVV